MNTTRQWDCAKTIPVSQHLEVAVEDIMCGSGDDGARTAATTSYDQQITQSFYLFLTAKIGGRPTQPNADGIDGVAVMSHQVLEQLRRQMGSYGVHIYEQMAVDCHDKHNEARFGTQCLPTLENEQTRLKLCVERYFFCTQFDRLGLICCQ